MIRPKILLAADDIIRDANTNMVSLINVTEELRPIGYPMLLPRFAVFALLERDLGDDPATTAALEIRLGEQIIHEKRFDLNFRTSRYARLNVKFQGFVINAPGLVRLKLTIGNESLESYAIEAFPVVQQPEVVNQDALAQPAEQADGV